jgi:hypothetical protein
VGEHEPLDAAGVQRRLRDPRAGHVDVALRVAPVDEGAVGQDEVGTVHEGEQRLARVGVTGERHHPTGGLDPIAVGLDRVVDPSGRIGERTDLERDPSTTGSKSNSGTSVSVGCP